MDTTATIGIRLRLEPGVRLQLQPSVHVSLDCVDCRRVDRTIVFDSTSPVICLKTRHPFPGKLIEVAAARDGGDTIGTYTIEYQTASFKDTKRGWPSVRHPTFASVAFSLFCPKCSRATVGGFQNNHGRPLARLECSCHAPLAAAVDSELPTLRACTRSGELLHEVTQSKYELFLGSVDGVSPITRDLLTDLTGAPWPKLCELASVQTAVYVQDKYAIDHPTKFATGP